jgi:hypothetical protein
MATPDRHPPEVSNFVVCPLPVRVDWELGIRVDPGVSLVVRIVVREVGYLTGLLPRNDGLVRVSSRTACRQLVTPGIL